MDPIRLMMRLKRIAKHPPSPQKVMVIFAVLALCGVIVAIEKFIGLPSWMMIDKMPKIR